MDPERIYRHFCMCARTLEVVGERWSLLIVRELQLGPRRFTDLVRSLDEITPPG
jgi:DNA-binding HxlR family transcriptional regulator